MSWKRVVIKVGTNVLSNEAGQIDEGIVGNLTQQIILLKNQGIEVYLVSSGAVGAGKSKLNVAHLNPVVRRQVYASIGQLELLNIYKKYFSIHGILCAQVLATKEDFRDRLHFINMRQCLLALLRKDIIPIINENDVISVNELMFTDNDELAGLIASLVNADTLIVLTNVDGVLKMKDDMSTVIQTIEPRDANIFGHISTIKSSFGRGGMATKVRICQKIAKLGIQSYIANGKKNNSIIQLLTEEGKFTWFRPEKAKSGIKKWMMHAQEKHEAEIVVNKGAADRLMDKNIIASLLPIGVVKIKGNFKKGDLVKIVDDKSNHIGTGITSYGSPSLENFMGKPGKKPIIHYDYLLIQE